MKSRIISAGLVILALTELIALAPNHGVRAQESNDKSPCVLVELFTSEGCSSCPPADRILTQLQKNQPVTGVTVITLSEHVPYWNYLGWHDPYSAELFSQRQQLYASSFGHSSVYTPQMIVDGRAQFIGSDYSKALTEIRASAALAKADITFSVMIKATQATVKGEIKLPDDLKTQIVSVYAALVEDDLHSVVNSGENSGRKLGHSSVVRQLENIGNFGAGKTIRFEKTINIAPSLKLHDLRMVVFAQETKKLRILAVSESRLFDAAR